MRDPNKDVQKYSQFKQKHERNWYLQGSSKTMNRIGSKLVFFLSVKRSVAVAVTLHLLNETRNKCFAQRDPVQKPFPLLSPLTARSQVNPLAAGWVRAAHGQEGIGQIAGEGHVVKKARHP